MECSFLELIRISVVWPPSWVRYAYTVKLCSQGVTYGFRQAKESSLSKFLFETVSGGKVGLQIELSPHELAELAGADFVNLKKS